MTILRKKKYYLKLIIRLAELGRNIFSTTSITSKDVLVHDINLIANNTVIILSIHIKKYPPFIFNNNLLD